MVIVRRRPAQTRSLPDGANAYLACEPLHWSGWRAGVGYGLTTECGVPTIEQCRTHAAEYKLLGRDPKISARRSSVLLSISRSWTALANQLEALTIIVKDEGK
jgi:hypothetical protein